jgi:hypothetical protein
MGRRVIILVSAMLAAIATTAGAGSGPEAGSTLPVEVRVTLAQQYPGWRFAAQSAVRLKRGQSPEWVSADFDGDGRADYAVQIVRPAPPDTAQLVLAFLRRAEGYEMHELLGYPQNEHSYLARARRGERRPDLDQDPNGQKRFVLRHDGVDVLYAEKAGHTCLYEDRRFRCVLTGD